MIIIDAIHGLLINPISAKMLGIKSLRGSVVGCTAIVGRFITKRVTGNLFQRPLLLSSLTS
jgi:hypothetical protein